tara:strand:- start:75 stop:821 length:747 start_codon:yes stop_codon:yes gene_type:complete
MSKEDYVKLYHDAQGPFYLINHKKRVILLWNGKCGCTSLKKWWADNLNPNDINDSLNYDGDSSSFHRWEAVIPNHTKDKYTFDVHAIFGYNPWNKDVDKKYQDYTKIMVIRNPWKRLVSHYIGQIQSNINYEYRVDHIYSPNLEGISFDEFIDLLLETPLDKLEMHYALQTANLHEDTKIDYIINTENMSIEIPIISKSLGFAATDIEKWGYPTNYTKDWKLYYNNISKNKVAKLYNKDIEVFGFKFD